VLCFDEFGPIEVKPYHGENWRQRADRIPANYTRDKGVRNLLAVLDLKTNKMYAHVRKRKTKTDVRTFLRYIRSLYPLNERLYIVMDNLSTHNAQDQRLWYQQNNIVAVYTPTSASWLNRIECHFTALKKFSLRNSNYKDHKEAGTAIRRYIAWRNNHTDNQEISRIENKIKLTI